MSSIRKINFLAVILRYKNNRKLSEDFRGVKDNCKKKRAERGITTCKKAIYDGTHAGILLRGWESGDTSLSRQTKVGGGRMNRESLCILARFKERPNRTKGTDENRKSKGSGQDIPGPEECDSITRSCTTAIRKRTLSR